MTRRDRSVVSGRTLADLADPPPHGRRHAGGPRRQAPAHRLVRPMLATLVDAPFDRPGWLFEVKWDGYRAVAEVGKSGGVRLYSRNHTSFDDKFAPVARALAGLGRDAVLDGEVVVVDGTGRSHFQLLQNYQKTGKGDLLYVVFDLLALDGKDLRDRPLVERKKLLKKLLTKTLPHVRYGDHVEEAGTAFFRAAVEQGLEGIIAKDGASRYVEGARSGAWVKVKTRQRQEAVVGGFTAPRGSRVGIGALVLGVYEGDELVYIGHTGGGLDTRGLEDLTARLTTLETKACPFRTRPKTNAPVKWVKPELVCEVAFQEWTHDGRMRQPIFVGLREDKPARQVRREVPPPGRPRRRPRTGPTGRLAGDPGRASAVRSRRPTALPSPTWARCTGRPTGTRRATWSPTTGRWPRSSCPTCGTGPCPCTGTRTGSPAGASSRRTWAATRRRPGSGPSRSRTRPAGGRSPTSCAMTSRRSCTWPTWGASN